MTDEDQYPQEEAVDSRLSILGQLKNRREEIRKGEHLDLPVPRWEDPTVIVKYTPLPHAVIRQAQDRVEKAPKQRKYETELNGNCDLLIRACDSVIARIDGQDYSLRPGDPKGEPTVFDPDLGENLGLGENATARDIVKALFITEGDILSHARSLVEWSGYREAEADEQLQGE